MVLVPPGREVCTRRRGFGDAVEDDGEVLGVVVEAGEVIGLGGIAVPAMLGFVAVFDFAFVRGIRGGLQEVFEQIDGVVEHVIIGAADVDVQLAAEFGTKLVPIALKDRGEIVVLLPVGGDVVVDDARFFVENGLRVAVLADGAVDGLPDVKLFAGAGV
jgi:hypothetical protein